MKPLRMPCENNSNPRVNECSIKLSLRAGKRKKLESWADFSDDLHRLANKVFPVLQVEVREELALSLYLDQLYPLQISFAVKQCCPKNLHEAVSSTIELESYLPPKEQSTVQLVNDGNDTQPPMPIQVPPMPIQAVQQQLLGVIQQLVEHVERLETKPPALRDREQHMTSPQRAWPRDIEDKDNPLYVTIVGRRVIMLEGVQSQGTPVEAKEQL